MVTIEVRIKTTEEVLGMCPGDPNLYENYIASNAPDAKTMEEEIEAIGVDGVSEKSMTVFARNSEGAPCFYDYQIKGMFKDICGMLKNADNTRSSKVKAHKKYIDGLVFVSPRMIPIVFSGEMTSCQRPLRASTPMGERIALANSECIPAGAYMEFRIKLLKKELVPIVKEWLEYGELRGLGQWRNSGKGTFTLESFFVCEQGNE